MGDQTDNYTKIIERIDQLECELRERDRDIYKVNIFFAIVILFNSIAILIQKL